MTKGNKQGGKKYKTNKKSFGDNQKSIVIKEECQHYALVTDVLGSGRFRCTLDNGSKVLAILSGKMKSRKVWVNKDDIILTSIRDYEIDKVDIIGKYNKEDYSYLKNIDPDICLLIREENDDTFEFDSNTDLFFAANEENNTDESQDNESDDNDSSDIDDI